jgi:hypothetical protein
MSEQKHICPKCSSELEHIRMLNPEIFGTDASNPFVGYVCRNDSCKGWYCNCCDEWHPYGTSCAVAMVRNVRGDNYQERDLSVCVDTIGEKGHE